MAVAALKWSVGRILFHISRLIKQLSSTRSVILESFTPDGRLPSLRGAMRRSNLSLGVGKSWIASLRSQWRGTPWPVGWVERSETHHMSVRVIDGFRCALPILHARGRRLRPHQRVAVLGQE